jgi:Tfp pilus assembly protein PilN
VIRTNLSTRPFYNVRAVRTAIGALVLVVVAITVFNAAQIIRLSASQRTLGAEAIAAEDEAARLRAEAVQIRARIDPEELEVVAEAASEANAIIDQRSFSWTSVFTHFETTLPDDVRITSVRWQPEQRTVSIGVQARSFEELNAFIEALEATAAFRNVFASREVTMEDETIVGTIDATYEQPVRGVEAQP